MPNINEGLTVGGDPGRMDAESARAIEQIRQQTAMSKTIRGESPMTDDELRHGIMNAHSATDVRAGLTFGDPEAEAAERAQIAQFAAEGRALLDQDARDRTELQARRAEDVYQDALDKLAGVGAEDEESYYRSQAAGWIQLSPTQRMRVIEEGFADLEDLPLLDALADYGRKVLADAGREDAALRARVAEGFTKAQIAERVLAEKGLTPGSPAAHAWAENVQGIVEHAGYNLDAMTPAQFEAHLRHADVVRDTALRKQATAQFQAQVLGAPSTNISEGLTVLGPSGWTSIQEPIVLDASIRPEDVDTSIRRKLGELDESPQAIRAGVTQESDLSRGMRQVQRVADKLFTPTKRER